MLTRLITRHAKHFVILLMVIVSLYLYFYKLDVIPAGFYIDEALPGYNAYSLLKTGRDEYGKHFPMFLRFYGSYNPPLFTYFTIPSIAIFGLNIFSVRFVSALAGLLTAYPVWKLLNSSGQVKNKTSLLIITFLFIISPWLILHSRVGYEVSLAFLLFTAGVYLAWRGLTKPKLLVPSFFILSLSTYAAYAERFLVPMFIFAFIFVFRKTLFRSNFRRHLKASLFVAFFIQIPHLMLLTTPAFLPKSNELASPAVIAQAQKIQHILPRSISLILAFAREFLSQYLTYFSPRSLFFLPDPDVQRSIPDLSALYFWMVIPYLVGLFVLWKQRKHMFSKLIIILAIVSPIPAALTKDPFATHRALPHLLPIILIIGLGIDRLIKGKSKLVWIPFFVVLSFMSLVLLWRSYFVLLPKERAKAWGLGVEQLAEEIISRPDQHFVIDQSRMKPLYIQLAFFMKYPPDEFQKSVNQNIKRNYYTDTSFDPNYQFANLETRGIKWAKDECIEQILVGDELAISSQQAKEHELGKVFEIRSPVDEIIFVGYETNPDKKCNN